MSEEGEKKQFFFCACIMGIFNLNKKGRKKSFSYCYGTACGWINFKFKHTNFMCAYTNSDMLV